MLKRVETRGSDLFERSLRFPETHTHTLNHTRTHHLRSAAAAEETCDSVAEFQRFNRKKELAVRKVSDQSDHSCSHVTVVSDVLYSLCVCASGV